MSKSQVGVPRVRPPALQPPPHLPLPAAVSGVHAHHPSYKQSNRSVHAGHPRPHAHPAAPPPNPSTFLNSPSPVTAGETSPTNLKGGVPVTGGMAATKGSQSPPRDDKSGSEDEDEKEKHKLEIRREKNRVKQRTLRIRRANHIVELETSISSLRREHALLQSAFSSLQQREALLESRIRDLGWALLRHGLSGEVDATRRAWSVISSSKAPPGGERGGNRPRTTSGRDPLNTMAQAALTPEHASEGAPLPPLASHWDRPTPRHNESEDKKCKRVAQRRTPVPPYVREIVKG